ncbi:phosphotransferase [Actinomadura sp. NBRC 104425]|uniref:phosphotransferase family protein n=1 Tax=Actinomadura sp. NBRC 104425 TaxID=3032204 RepID=UPI0025574AEE|nr:phosphotransferase [Actinomadura sp. NBRC 104425]
MRPPVDRSPRVSPPALFERLAEIGRARSAGGDASVLYDRHGVLVVRVGDVVVKAHQADRDGGPRLERRMRVAASLPELLLPPLDGPLRVDGRVVTVWPYGEPVSPDAVPWEEAGRLLAALHTCPVPADAPPWGRPTRVGRLVRRLPDGPEAAQVRRAFATLPSWIRAGEDDGGADGGAPQRLIHGDWHLGQLVRAGDGWRLIDVEDLGRGDPVWDLARPAALFSAGVLPPGDWARFLRAYREAGGPAVPSDGDLWRVLDLPARTLAIQIAATCVISARADGRPLDGPERALVDTCGRICEAGPGMT